MALHGLTSNTAYLLLSARAGSVCDRYNAKLCQTDATSRETENGGSERRFGYICPELKTWYMEVVIIEKKTFEALLSGVETLVGKVGTLCRRCNDKQMQKWLDGEEVCRLLRISPRTLQSDNRLYADQPKILLQARRDREAHAHSRAVQGWVRLIFIFTNH